jgi:hypothetical protein
LEEGTIVPYGDDSEETGTEETGTDENEGEVSGEPLANEKEATVS